MKRGCLYGLGCLVALALLPYALPVAAGLAVFLVALVKAILEQI